MGNSCKDLIKHNDRGRRRWRRSYDVIMAVDVIKVLSNDLLTTFYFILLLSTTLTKEVDASDCQVITQGCSFPFDHDGQEYHSCRKIEDVANNKSDYVCKITMGSSQQGWATCDSGCFENDSPMEFAKENRDMSMFCKSKPVPCVFPFNFDDHEYLACTDAGTDGSYQWCATAVHENGTIKDNMIAKCNPEKCVKEEQSSQPKRYAEVLIDSETNEEGIGMTLDITQEGDVITLKGFASGLPPGKHGFHVHEYGDLSDKCMAAGAHFNPNPVVHGDMTRNVGEAHVGDWSNIEADDQGYAIINKKLRKNGASLVEGDELSILGRAVVIHADEDDLGLGNSPNSKTTGNAGPRLACGIIELKPAVEWKIIIIIIIILLVIIALLTILIIYLVCKCLKGKKKSHWPTDDPKMNGIGDGPLSFREMSIPFIDASPAPSPRPGRSTDRFSSMPFRKFIIGLEEIITNSYYEDNVE